MAKIVRTPIDGFEIPDAQQSPDVQIIAGLEVRDQDDFSKLVVIPVKMLPKADREKHPAGFPVVFRDPSHKDIELFNKFRREYDNEIEAIKRFAVLLCTKWGNANNVTPIEWEQTRGVITMALAQIVSSFFLPLGIEQEGISDAGLRN